MCSMPTCARIGAVARILADTAQDEQYKMTRGLSFLTTVHRFFRHVSRHWTR